MSTVAGLTSALADTSIGHMFLAPGTYALSAELSITRSVVLEAVVPGSVVLDAQARTGQNSACGGVCWSSLRRVLNINPGSLGVVQLIGLNITRGSEQAGGGVWIRSGTVTVTSGSIYNNVAKANLGLGLSRGGGVYIIDGTVAFND